MRPPGAREMLGERLLPVTPGSGVRSKASDQLDPLFMDLRKKICSDPVRLSLHVEYRAPLLGSMTSLAGSYCSPRFFSVSIGDSVKVAPLSEDLARSRSTWPSGNRRW